MVEEGKQEMEEEEKALSIQILICILHSARRLPTKANCIVKPYQQFLLLIGNYTSFSIHVSNPGSN